MTHQPPPLEDETLISEITIQADGRVFVFGTSRQLLEVLKTLRPGDPAVSRLLAHVRRLEQGAPPERRQ